MSRLFCREWKWKWNAQLGEERWRKAWLSSDEVNNASAQSGSEKELFGESSFYRFQYTKLLHTDIQCTILMPRMNNQRR
jgi:hypothetical protein